MSGMAKAASSNSPLQVHQATDVTAQALRLGNVLKAADVPVTVFGAKETTHVKINVDLGTSDDPTTTAPFAFVEQALK
jgi:arylformamidase